MMSARIVVTGFEPWEHGTENPTLEILDQLDSSNDVEGELTTMRLPVDSTKLDALVDAMLERVRPDVWISLGLSPGLAVIGVERIAGNVLDFPIPDNAGHQPAGQPVFADGPAAYFATLPIKAIAFGLRDVGIPAKISNSASTYGCNQMMYTVLHKVACKGMATRAGFIHVPASPSLAAKQTYPLVEMPSMAVDLMTRAVRTA
ncbi:MAG: pyroglutamyl-peptidase I, partial [Acetobacteraceae bacterium]|nr:pyroglutamyl-peptidase I [Acetobacteraceae bacterium]